MKTAKFVKDIPGKGIAKLYKLSEPISGYSIDEVYTYVVVSGVVAFDTGKPETYIFPSTEDGKIVEWIELDGSFRGSIDHDLALSNAGYTVE